MRWVGIRELRADLAAAVRAAGAGERVVITVDGRPVAELGPVGGRATEATLVDLAARGLVVLPPRDDRDDPEPIEGWPGLRLDRILREVR